MKLPLFLAFLLLATPALAGRDSEVVEPLHRQQASYHVPKAKGRLAERRERYGPLVRHYARRHGVPVKLAFIIIHIESRWNPRARSRKGARGLGQIMPATARRLGYRGSTKALYRPETNVKWAMAALDECYELAGGNWRKTAICYNSGPKRTHYRYRRLPRETRRYIRMVERLRRA